MKRVMIIALVLVTIGCARLPVQRQPDLVSSCKVWIVAE